MSVSSPLVSVIVITYNSYVFVVETLESIKKQTYQNIELIISDDGSNDQTVRLCRDWVNANRDRFVNVDIISVEKNSGIPANCNRGVKAANGEWIKIIAADDALFQDCIEEYIYYIKSYPGRSILFSNGYYYNNILDDRFRAGLITRHEFRCCKEESTADDQFEVLLRVHFVFTPSLLISRSVFLEIGCFDDNLMLWEDTPFLLKATRSGFKIYYVNFESCKYRRHINSTMVKDKSFFIFNNFEVEYCKYKYNNYLNYFSGFERILNAAYILLVLTFIKFNLNNRNFISLSLHKILICPLKKIILKINKRYM